MYNLDNLIDRGIVTAHRRRYYLRVPSLGELIKELRRDTDRLLEDLEEQAKQLDVELGLEE